MLDPIKILDEARHRIIAESNLDTIEAEVGVLMCWNIVLQAKSHLQKNPAAFLYRTPTWLLYTLGSKI